ncbi:hypothetical protein HDU93_005748, partial [Gonapodya sp. JEL0774]
MPPLPSRRRATSPRPPLAITRGLPLVVVLLALNCVSTTWAVAKPYHAQHGVWLKECPGDMRINIAYDLYI